MSELKTSNIVSFLSKLPVNASSITMTSQKLRIEELLTLPDTHIKLGYSLL